MTSFRPDDPATWPLALTVLEVADVLRISRGSAYQAVKKGAIPAVKVGNTWRVPRARLLEMVGEETTQPSPTSVSSWDEWLNGAAHRLTLGKDYESVAQLVSEGSVLARRQGLRVELRGQDDSHVLLQAVAREAVQA